MRFLRKFRLGLKLVSLTLPMFLLSPCYATGINSARIYPTNKVTIFTGGQQVGIYTREAPLPEGYTLSTDGKCAVKMDEIYMVAEDKSSFSIDGSANQRSLFIGKGIVYFRMSEMKRPINFVTPAGNINAQSIIFRTSSENKALIGYVKATNSRSELGIVDGGSMVVLTDNGLRTVSQGKKIMLAISDMDIGPPKDSEPETEETETPTAAENTPQEQTTEQPGPSTGTMIAMGAVGTGLAAGTLLALGGSGGGSGGGSNEDVSPSGVP